MGGKGGESGFGFLVTLHHFGMGCTAGYGVTCGAVGWFLFLLGWWFAHGVKRVGLEEMNDVGERRGKGKRVFDGFTLMV